MPVEVNHGRVVFMTEMKSEIHILNSTTVKITIN